MNDFKEAIESLIITLCCSKTKFKDTVREKIFLALEENKDIQINLESEDNMIFYGDFVNELKTIDSNIVLVYKSYENLFGIVYEYFGFIYQDIDVFVDYRVNLQECFHFIESEEIDYFFKDFLEMPDDTPHREGFDNYFNTKKTLGNETYNLVVDFMLKKTNNKLKNSIYKIF